MNEKELLERKIKLLVDRKRLLNAEIDMKLDLLENALSLQDGYTMYGKYGYRYEEDAI